MTQLTYKSLDPEQEVRSSYCKSFRVRIEKKKKKIEYVLLSHHNPVKHS